MSKIIVEGMDMTESCSYAKDNISIIGLANTLYFRSVQPVVYYPVYFDKHNNRYFTDYNYFITELEDYYKLANVVFDGWIEYHDYHSRVLFLTDECLNNMKEMFHLKC